MSLRTLDKPGTAFNVHVAEQGVVARLVCECGAVLAEAHLPDVEPEDVAADEGEALRARLAWGYGLLLRCDDPSHGKGRNIRLLGGTH